MAYPIRDVRFDVTYAYRDGIDSDEEFVERRKRVAWRCFGDKSIACPPLPLDDDIPDHDL